MSDDQPVKNLNVLLVEDETLVSLFLEDMLKELGAGTVWHAASIAVALDLLKTRRPAIAILDLNLGDGLAYPVAEQLTRAAIPFIFVSGYGRDGLEPRWANRPVLQKPVMLAGLAKALQACLA